jgi:hypothetical protein
MKKEDIEKQLIAVLSEADRLQEKSEIELKTAEFLKDEADKLLIKMEDKTLGFQERELLSKQMEAMHARLNREVKQFESGALQLQALEKKLDYLKELVESGQMES